MTIIEITKGIVEYGVVPIALAVAVVFIIIALKEIRKNNEDQTRRNDEQQKQLTQLFTTLVNVKTDTDHRHTRKEEEENRKVNMLINQQLQRLLLHVNANRICCFLYHNGGYSVTGRSFQKMSIMFEQIDENTVSVMGSYQNVPRAMFPILFQKITEQGYYYIEHIKDIEKIDTMTYQTFVTRGTKSAFIRGIIDSKGNVLGFITIEFSTNEYRDLDDLKERLKNKAIKISGILEAAVADNIELKEGGVDDND